jgi:hypothetical protein
VLIRPVLLPLIFVPGLVPLSAWVRSNRQRDRTVKRRASLIAVGALLIATAAANYAWTYNTRSDREWGRWLSIPGQNGRTIQQYFVTVHLTAIGPALITALDRQGAPHCLARSYDPGATMDTFLRSSVDGCYQGLDWVSDHYVADLGRVLIANPSLAERYFQPALHEQAQQRADGSSSVPTPVPRIATALFFSERPGLDNPLVIWSAIAAGLLSFRWWSSSWRRRLADTTVLIPTSESVTKLRITVGATVASAYVGMLGTALLSPTDFDRVGLAPATLLRLTLIVLLTRCVVALLDTRQRLSLSTRSVGDARPKAHGDGKPGQG